MDIHQVTIRDFVDLKEVEDLYREFSQATGFTFCLVDHITNEVLIQIGWRDICVKFHRAFPESSENCRISMRKLGAGFKQAGEIHIQRCENGLVYGYTPVIVQGKTIACLCSGQVLFAPPDVEQFRKRAKQNGYDEQEYLKSLADVPIVSEERFTAILHYLARSVSMIAETGYSNLEFREKSKEKEALLQSILSSAPVGIGVVVDRVIQWTNKKMSEITGYTADELIGQQAKMFYRDEEEFDRVGRVKYSQIQAKGIGSVDTQYKQKNGSFIDVHLSFTPINQQNLAAGVTFSALDITDRNKALAAILKNEQRLQLALEGGDLGMWDLNIKTGEVYFSPEFFTMLGYDREELPHTMLTWEDLLHPEERKLIKQKILNLVKGESNTWNQEFRMRAKDGRYLWILGRGKFVDVSEGEKPLRAVGTHFDITEQKQTEEALIRSKKEWERTFDAMPDIVTLLDKNLSIIRANKAACKSLGLSVEEIIGYSCFTLFRGASKPCNGCHRLNSNENFVSYSKEMYHEKLGKTFLVSAAPVFDEQGELEYIIHVAKDISALKKSEEGRLRLATAIDQASESIMVCSSEGSIQYVNPAFESSTGFTSEEAVNQNCCFLSSDKEDCVLSEKMWPTLSRGETWRGSLINRKKDGSLFEEEATITPVKDSENRITNFVAVKRDVSHEKSLEKQLRQAVKMEAIGTLAGGIAHDFNNILSAILGYSEMARAQLPADDPVRKDLDCVIKSGNRATDLVKQILTFSRQEEGDLKPFKVHFIVGEVLKMLRSTLPTTITLKENVATDCRPILADSTQLHQVLMNLCTNAKHAIGLHTGVIHVSLSEREVTDTNGIADCPQIAVGTYLDLEISDTGCGMDELIQSKIFDPFFTTKEKGKGTGLGLAVVHGIIKQHKGEITVSSEPGLGTTFHIYLPIIPEEYMQPLQLANEDISQGSERILIVDDERVLGQLMQRMLKSLGYKTTFFTSSIDALDTFRSNPDEFDLVITDMTMPEMTGIDLTRELLDLQPDLPVILCTGFSEAISEATARSFGICEYVTKPIDRYTLARTVRKALVEALEHDVVTQ